MAGMATLRVHAAITVAATRALVLRASSRPGLARPTASVAIVVRVPHAPPEEIYQALSRTCTYCAVLCIYDVHVKLLRYLLLVSVSLF